MMVGYQTRRHREMRQHLADTPFPRQLRHGTLRPPSACPTIDEVSHPRFLHYVFRERRARGGQAPGADGLGYPDYSLTECGAEFRQVSRAIRRREYLPEPALRVEIAREGRPPRPLHLRVIIDRVVSAALTAKLTPYLDQYLGEHCYGFRPRHSIYHLFAAVERQVLEHGRYFIAPDDVRSAFSSLIVASCLESLRRHINNDDLMWLVETVLRGHDGNQRIIGIDQGDSFSPLAMNLFLRYALDLPLSAADLGDTLQLRYADDLTYLGSSVHDVRRAVQMARTLLDRHGLQLKGEVRDPINLRRQGAWVDLLGLRLSLREGRLVYGLGRNTQHKLRIALQEARMAPDHTLTAREVVRGWLGALGPVVACEGVVDVLRIARQEAAQAGYRELGPPEELVRCAEEAQRRWTRLRDGQSTVTPASSTAAYGVTRTASGLGVGGAWPLYGEIPWECDVPPGGV